MTQTKYLTAEEVRAYGILQEINRQLLHPRGLAAEVNMETGAMTIQDHRYDPEGMIYAEGVMKWAKYIAFLKLGNAKITPRIEALGYVVQPAVQPVSEQSTEQAVEVYAIKAGGVVCLKTEGPKMTVDEFDKSRSVAHCVWFDDNMQLQREEFKADALKLAV